MKSFKDFLEERKQIDEATLKTGTKVTVKNAKSYDSLSKKNEVEGIVQGMMNKNTVMVKVGSGQMNVDLKDIVESVQIDEARKFIGGDILKVSNGKDSLYIDRKNGKLEFSINMKEIAIFADAADIKAIKDHIAKV